MTLNEIVLAAHAVLNKEQRGNVLSPAQYTTVFKYLDKLIYDRYLDDLKRAAVQSGILLAEALHFVYPMARFVSVADINMQAGEGALPANHYHPISALAYKYITYTQDDSDPYGEADPSMQPGTSTTKAYLPIDIITPFMFDKRMGNILAPNPVEHPFAKIAYNTHLVMIPQNIDKVKYQYLRTSISPYYDYCIKNSDYSVVYMPVGSYVKQAGGPLAWDLYDSSNNLLVSGVTHLSNPLTTYTSKTSELDWDDATHPLFVTELVKLMATGMRDQLPIAVASQEART